MIKKIIGLVLIMCLGINLVACKSQNIEEGQLNNEEEQNKVEKINNLKIKWHGQSCFEISDGNQIWVIDPYDDTIGYGKLELTANKVLVSHNHYDHNNTNGVKILDYVADSKKDVKEMSFKEVDSFHDEVNGEKRGENIIHTINALDLNICHLGDLGHILDEDQLKQISEVDVLLIPVGGKYTIDAKQAVEVIKQINPKVIIPMHYKTDVCNIDIAPVDEFLRLIELEYDVEYYIGSWLELKVDENIDKKVIVLNYEDKK